MRLTCFITGKSQDVDESKISTFVKKYRSVENLNNYFVSAKAEKLIKKGFTIDEIRKQLEIDTTDLESSTDLQGKLSFHITSNVKHGEVKTDETVKAFLNTLRKSKL